MGLSPEAIEEFKKLYKKRFGVDLSDKEAVFRAENLVGLYRAVYFPMKAAPPTEITKKKHG